VTEQVYPMKPSKIYAALFFSALIASLASCGGGGDAEAGSPTSLGVQPTTATVTGGSATSCYSGYVGEFFVYGGAAPYRLANTVPDAMVLDRSTVADRGGSFNVNFTGICISPALIVIVDKLDHQVVLTLNNKPPAAAPAASAVP
jgi:hypothetical protein